MCPARLYINGELAQMQSSGLDLEVVNIKILQDVNVLKIVVAIGLV